MRLKKNYVTAAAVFLLVVSTGYVLRNGDALATRFGVTASASAPTGAQARRTANDIGPSVSAGVGPGRNIAISLPRPPAAALSPVKLSVDGAGLAARVAPGEPAIDRILSGEPAYSSFGLPCRSKIGATALAAAMVDLVIDTPCRANERVTIGHEGLEFTLVTSQIGRARVVVPALASTAEFSVRFETGETLRTMVSVSDFSAYDRVAIQWQGKSGLQIHALEFGAGYGEEGHVWQKAPRNSEFAQNARGGFLTRLGTSAGTNSRLAEIYSFPTESIGRQGVVRLNVEAEVTAYNCGRELSAQALQVVEGEGMIATDLTLSMPDCESVGDFLVLKNLLRDLKIARN